MHGDRYDYRIEVTTAAALLGARYGFVATVLDLSRHRADGTVERLMTPFGQYHGEDATEAEGRAREAVERWIESQRMRDEARS